MKFNVNMEMEEPVDGRQFMCSRGQFMADMLNQAAHSTQKPQCSSSWGPQVATAVWGPAYNQAVFIYIIGQSPGVNVFRYLL